MPGRNGLKSLKIALDALAPLVTEKIREMLA